MGLRAEVTVVPGPVDPSTGEPSPDPPYKDALDDFLDTPGVAGTEVETELKRAQVAASQGTEESVAGWWSALQWFFTGERHTVLEQNTQVVELGGYWVIPPGVSDSSAKLTVGLSSSNEKSASFTIAGIGGGPTFTIDLEEDLTHEATECVRITLTAVGVFQKVQVTRDGQVITTYPRLVSVDRDNLSWTISKATPPDAASLGRALATTRIDVSGVTGSTTRDLEISHGTTWDLSAGLDLPNLGGIKAQVSTKIVYKQDVKFEYTLPAGHTYTASRYNNFPAYLWSVT